MALYKGNEQCVIINIKKSSYLNTKTGTPLGLVLGLILFSLYIHDLPESCKGAGLQMYADDAVVYEYRKNSNCSFRPIVKTPGSNSCLACKLMSDALMLKKQCRFVFLPEDGSHQPY